MVDLPHDLTNPIALADWLELSALEAGDGNASAGDLTSALQIHNIPGSSEDMVLQVILELEHREKAAGEAYPFVKQSATLLQLKGDWKQFAPYVFCLCLSYFQWRPAGGELIDPRKLFEEISLLAAESYIQGESFPFGRACASGANPFETAVNQLCRRLGEGNCFVRRSSVRRRDDRVDIVVWKPFEDKLPSKLIMFGQCASGENWKDKLAEMQPDSFWSNWIVDPNVSPLLRSFYIPHAIDRNDWSYYALNGGILFDRCRIALWAHRSGTVSTDDRYVDWCQTAFPTIRRN